jgi:hypothetical protein
MKSTKLILAVIATFLIIWIIMGFIEYMLCITSFIECMTHTATILTTIAVGWVPALGVGINLYKSNI